MSPRKKARRPFRKRKGKSPDKSGGQTPTAPRTELKLARRGESEPAIWELVHPRCARQRAEDIEEVRLMLEAGEFDVARDELRWLLDGCTDCVDAHHLLGEVAAAEGDFPLARGHFGYVHQICTATFPPQGLTGTLPGELLGNRTFYESSMALAHCLKELGQTARALQVLEELRRLDPADPLGIGELWRAWSSEVQQIKLL